MRTKKNKHHMKQKFHNEAEDDEDDDSLSTTDSDHQELLRISHGYFLLGQV
jgi:hypothetical protein